MADDEVGYHFDTPGWYEKKNRTIPDLFSEKEIVFFSAPLVRHSHLPFRILSRSWGCDVACTPMTIAQNFVSSSFCRDSHYQYLMEDAPTVVQFAAKDAEVFGRACELVAPYCHGVDINSGCPIKGHVKKGYGCALLKNPQLICDMVREGKSRCDSLPISVKTRLLPDLRDSVEMARRIEHMGASWVSFHGRLQTDRSAVVPVNLDGLKIVKSAVSIPMVGNGDIFSKSDALNMAEKTGVNGIMAARGILENPSLFLGTDTPPPQCLSDFLYLSMELDLPFRVAQKTLSWQLTRLMMRRDRCGGFLELEGMEEMVDYVEDLCGRTEEGRGKGGGRGRGRGRGRGKSRGVGEGRGGWEGRRLPTEKSLRRVMVIRDGGRLERRWEGKGEEEEEGEGGWGEGKFYCLRKSLRRYLEREKEAGGFVEQEGEEEEGSGLRKEDKNGRGLEEEILGEGGEGGLGGLFEE